MTTMEDYESRVRQRYLDRANLPAWSHSYGIENMRDEVQKACSRFIEVAAAGPETMPGLLLMGPPGRGKTTAAIATLRGVLLSAPRPWLGKEWEADARHPGWYTTYAELIRMHKLSWETEGDESAKAREARWIIDGLYASSRHPSQNTRVLVLDDVGKEHSGRSDFTKLVLHDLLRSRWDKGAPTIITTNLRLEDWSVYGEAMASFISDAFVPVAVRGQSYRSGGR